MSVNPTDVGLPSGTGPIVPFTVLSQQRTAWVTGPNTVIDAMRIGVRTGTHGVELAIMVPYLQWQLNGAALIATPIVNGIEVILDIPAADDAWFVEDAGPSGVIAGFIEYLVSIAPPAPDLPGPMSTTVLVPITKVADYTAVQSLLDAARQQLRNAAAQ